MVSKEFHASRRSLYADQLKDKSMAFVFSGETAGNKGDQRHPFVPYANFYYLTGFDQPKAVLMTVKTGGTVTETLYIDHPDAMRARWEGADYSKESVRELTGIDHVEYLERFEEYLPVFQKRKPIENLYVDLGSWEKDFRLTPGQEFAQKVLRRFPCLKLHDTFALLGELRKVKTKEEIALHRKACEITVDGVKNILTHLRPDMYEYEIEAHFDYTLKSQNADHAFATIAASGPNACVLHYMKNNRKMKDGDLILFDLGAEFGRYAADVSRTFPVNGTFTKQQKDLYNVVLKGLEEAIKRTKPGQPKEELQKISRQVMAKELIGLGMIEKEEEISKYYYHGSGHYIGLYCHDVGEENVELEPNMMFTLEPGLYFEELGIGIRIEDTLLITEDGCEVLTGDIPKTVEEIEAFMAAHK